YASIWLSFHWFFWPRIKQSLPLAFLTHNPITAVCSLYVVALSLRSLGEHALHEIGAPALGALVVGLWFPIAAWETSRKVRLPEDETEYTTYSKVLGWKTAALVPAGFVAVSASCVAFAALRAGAGTVYLALLGAVAGVTMGRSVLLRLAPTRARTNL